MNPNNLIEPSKTIPIKSSYDCIICGGGIAGCAAALAARRTGAKVLLLERMFGLGGLATLGNIIVYLPLCDGAGNQVSGGLAEELLRLSVRDVKWDDSKRCVEVYPSCWETEGAVEERKKRRLRVEFNPASFSLALEEQLIEEGVNILYDTRLCAVQKEQKRISAVIVENKDGRSAYTCSTAIDATGDADLAFQAGCETASNSNNVVSTWYYTDSNSEINLHRHTSVMYDMFNRPSENIRPVFSGDNAKDVTDQILLSRQKIRENLEKQRTKFPEKQIFPTWVNSIPCFRMTRRIISRKDMTQKEHGIWHEDTIGFVSDWRYVGPVNAVPYRSLQSETIENLLVAGRCIGADDTIWDVTRAIPQCAVTGEAAGTAAGLAAINNGGNVQTVPIDKLQATLKSNNVILDKELLANSYLPEKLAGFK